MKKIRLCWVSCLVLLPAACSVVATTAEVAVASSSCDNDGNCMASSNHLPQEAVIVDSVNMFSNATAAATLNEGMNQEEKDHTTMEKEENEEGTEELDEEEEYDEEDYDEEEEELGIEFGVAQASFNYHDAEVDDREVLELIEATGVYMKQFAETVDFHVKVRGVCSNEEEDCSIWAVMGSCETERDYMLQACGPACQACQPPPVGPGSQFGVIQQMEAEVGGPTEEGAGDDDAVMVTSDEIWAKLEEAERYFNQTVMVDTFYAKVRKLCFNKNENCTLWAAQGFCDVPGELEYMEKECAPACGMCHMLHYETRCPIDPEENVLKPGDLNRMFERLIADPAFDTTVYSRPDYLPGDTEETAIYKVGPWIITIDDFITPEEASRLIKWGGDMGYERSEEVGGVDEDTGEQLESIISLDRTSTNAWCHDECEDDQTVKMIFERIEQMTGVPPEHSESLQLLKYEHDQFYSTHNDYIPMSHRDQGGPRILTVFLYLTDVEEGGETRFDYHNLLVKPKLGRVAMWPSVLDHDPSEKEDRTNHEAMPVIKGTKFAANAWLHLRNYSKASANKC